MAQKKVENKRTAPDCGLTNDDNSPPRKKRKLEPTLRAGPKRKVALIVSYLGTKYHGSAFNFNYSTPSLTADAADSSDSYPTVSSALFKTICKIGAISQENATDPKKVSFSASSRTDKGVHAAAATFSLKMINLFKDSQTQNNNCDSEWIEMKDLLNKSLLSEKKDIFIQCILRTTKGFDPRFNARSRVYHYIIPTYLFDANIHTKDMKNIRQKFYESIAEKVKVRANKNKNILNENENEHEKNNEKEEKEKEKDVRFGYRMNEELLNKLRELCVMFIGTKNYHNFTRKTHPKQDKAKRFMHSIDVMTNDDLIVDNVQYLQFEIHGSSFLYHQIRKMIGLLVTLMRNIKYEYGECHVDGSDAKKLELEEIAFSYNYKMAIPLAPSQGLYLKAVHFDEYNAKCIRDGHDWKQLKFEKYENGTNKFIIEKIIPSITSYEINEANPLQANQFAFWLFLLENEFKFEIVQITKELLRKLKDKGIQYVTAGNKNESIDTFYKKMIDNKITN